MIPSLIERSLLVFTLYFTVKGNLLDCFKPPKQAEGAVRPKHTGMKLPEIEVMADGGTSAKKLTIMFKMLLIASLIELCQQCKKCRSQAATYSFLSFFVLFLYFLLNHHCFLGGLNWSSNCFSVSVNKHWSEIIKHKL